MLSSGSGGELPRPHTARKFAFWVRKMTCKRFHRYRRRDCRNLADIPRGIYPLWVECSYQREPFAHLACKMYFQNLIILWIFFIWQSKFVAKLTSMLLCWDDKDWDKLLRRYRKPDRILPHIEKRAASISAVSVCISQNQPCKLFSL